MLNATRNDTLTFKAWELKSTSKELDIMKEEIQLVAET